MSVCACMYVCMYVCVCARARVCVCVHDQTPWLVGGWGGGGWTS